MRIPTFFLFMMMVLFSPLAIDIFLPAIPLMAQSLPASVASVQVLVPLFALCMGFGQLIAGPVADRIGRRPLALVGIGVYLFASFGAGWANNVELLWIMRALQGLGTCAIVVSAYSGVRDRYQGPKLAAIYSYINGVICVVPALAPLLGGLLTEAYGWRANFWFMGGYAIVIGTLIWRLLPETRPANTVTEGALISWDRYRPVLANSTFQFYVGLVTLSFTIIMAYVTYSTDVLMVQMAQSPMAFALWFGSNAAINVVGAFVAPSLIKRFGKRNCLIAGSAMCVTAGIMLMAMLQWHHPLAFMLPVYLGSVGFCFLLAIGSGAAMAPFGERAGTASALLGVMQMSGASILLGLVSLLPFSATTCLGITMLLPALWWFGFSKSTEYNQIGIELNATGSAH